MTRTSAHGEAAVAYTVNTKRARSEITAQTTQVALLRALVANAASDRSQDPQIGRTLFQLLVPTELEPFFGDTTDMLLELDDSTAGIPWELLDTATRGGGDGAALGHPREAAAQAAHGRLPPADARRGRRRERPGDRRAALRPRPVPGAPGGAGGGARGLRDAVGERGHRRRPRTPSSARTSRRTRATTHRRS